MIFKNHCLYNIDLPEIIKKNSNEIEITTNDIHNTLSKHTNHVLVLTIVQEAYGITDWKHHFYKFINLIKQKHPTTPILLIINSWYQNQVDFIDKSLVDDVVFIDFYLLMTYNRLLVNKESPVATTWNSALRNFLFLTGKPYKIHRIRLLYKFFEKNLLKHATWSLFMNNDLRHLSRKFLSELSNAEYDLFLRNHTQNPDNISLQNNCHYDGIPYQLDLYQNNLFQIISETYFSDSTPWITEKTWLSIVNKRPFIMASSSGTLLKLKKMGFKTFENYLKIPYDTIQNQEQRLNAIVVNTEYWLAYLHNYKNDVEKDIEYNFQNLIDLAQVNLVKLQNLIDSYKLDCKITELIQLSEYFSISQKNVKWRVWYNSIRDNTWPDCETENNFVNLPYHIQQECIHVFNYKLKEVI